MFSSQFEVAPSSSCPFPQIKWSTLYRIPSKFYRAWCNRHKCYLPLWVVKVVRALHSCTRRQKISVLAQAVCPLNWLLKSFSLKCGIEWSRVKADPRCSSFLTATAKLLTQWVVSSTGVITPSCRQYRCEFELIFPPGCSFCLNSAWEQISYGNICHSTSKFLVGINLIKLYMQEDF